MRFYAQPVNYGHGWFVRYSQRAAEGLRHFVRNDEGEPRRYDCEQSAADHAVVLNNDGKDIGR